MSSIDELQRKYPTIPRDVIIKWDLLSRGIRDSDDLDKVSEWAPAGGSYQTYDHDLTLKDVVEKRPWRLKPGQFLRPNTLAVGRNGMNVMIQRDTKSPYELRDQGGERLAIYENDEKVEDVFYLRPKKRSAEPLLTSKGTPASSMVTVFRRCFFIFPVRYCEYFDSGDQCKFCNFNATQEDSRSVGLGRTVTVNLPDTVEAYKILGSKTSFIEGRFEMGGFANAEKEAKLHFDFVEKIGSALPNKPNLTIHTEATDRKSLQRLKDSGLDAITFQLEVWDPELFAEILPGKSKTRPYDRWLESFQDAVDIFGVGNVGGKIIAGLTLMPDKGHMSWQEARDCHIAGNTWLIKNGIMPVLTSLRLPPGSVYGNTPALREKLPPTEYYLDVALAHHEAMMDVGLYQKLNKLMYCAFDCVQNLYCGEIGMLQLAGNIGNWMSSAVPEDANWLAKFISAMESTSTSIVEGQ